MNSAILALNAGSSSIKFALYTASDHKVLLRGSVDALGGGQPHFSVSGELAIALSSDPDLPATGTIEEYLSWLFNYLNVLTNTLNVVAVGHRVTHGGRSYHEPVLVNDKVITALEELIPLAPMHEPSNIAGIHVAQKHWPNIKQVACFDTAFHQTQPRLAELFAIPRILTEQGVVRYGFHGLSYEYIAKKLPEFAGQRAKERVIVAHLGHGASLCAMQDGCSVGSSMGFTALDGLMMGKRCGTIDPGVVLYMIRQLGMSADTVSDVLNTQSGLLGVSGLSSDVRTLEESDSAHAQEALALFAYKARQAIGALAASLGGLDILVFTAGIGENSSTMRANICEGMSWLGIQLDADTNRLHGSNSKDSPSLGTQISSVESAVDVYVIPTDEEATIVRSVSDLVPMNEYA